MKKKTPEDIIKKHEANVRASLVEHGLVQVLVVHFPNRKKVPLMGRLGAWLVNKAGGIIVTKYGFTNDTLISKQKRRA